jgi:S-adenosylmethionine:tRNA ribosyltransferase-isomerase
MMDPRKLRIEDFEYTLPETRIASYPLEIRDESKLLVYQQGAIHENSYGNLADELPANSLLVFNDTRVIEARLLFKKETGGVIEIFCLEPATEYPEITTALMQKNSVNWNCLVGGASKWKHGKVLQTTHPLEGQQQLLLRASIVGRISDAFRIHFEWEPHHLTFAEVLHYSGQVPLPPYLHRQADPSDSERYQTIYAAHDGSVAAPTAGLHFTDRVFEKLQAKNIHSSFVTLHVGAGTFKPVQADSMQGHDMHAEFIDVSLDFLKTWLKHDGPVFAVGTTSLRTLESLVWMGLKVIQQPRITENEIALGQWEVYDNLMSLTHTTKECIEALTEWMERMKLNRLITRTQLLIVPGYPVKSVEGLITNFHQPRSTLLLLVAALIGDDWKNVYTYALEKDFRFLSYGDGCLLFRK